MSRAGRRPIFPSEMNMQNPFDFDPRRLRLDDDDEEDEKQQEQQKGDSPNPYEKAMFESRTLLISGPVDDKMLKEATVRAMAMEAKDPKAPITVMINSPGGSADSGFAIYDMLRFVRPPVSTVVNGLCASAAILVLLATDKKRRFSLPESRFLLHQPSTMGRGTASDLDITAREIIKLRERYNRIVAETCNQNIDKITEDTRRDFWLNAAESKEYGLVAKVITRSTELPE